MEAGKPSKFRHTFGSVRSKSGYEAVKPRSTRDGSLIKANSSIVVVQWATSGFGALAVVPTRDSDKSGKLGRIGNPPLIEAHKSSLQDFDVSPYDERLIVTSDGGAIKLWKVPEGGLTETMREASGELTGEAVKRLSALNFHPTSSNLLTTCGKDFALRLFDIENTSSLVTFKDSHSDLIMSTSWSKDGKLVATGCKDKKLRIGDPRAGKVVHTTEAHPGVKGFTATWLGQRDQILSAGFSKNGERQIALWDVRSFSTALNTTPVDTSPGMITPYYDEATEMVFLLGRGDSTIRYYEINDEEPFVHYLDQYRGADSQADITPFAKRLVDYGTCEIVRFAKLTKDKIEHLMFQVPRKDAKDIFHEDLYRYVPSSKPSTTAQEWIKGATKDKIYLTTKEMLPSGLRSSYDLDPTKKAEDEKREQEKRAYQQMNMDERAIARDDKKKADAAKKGTSVAKSDDDDDAEADAEADQAVLAKFGSHSRSQSMAKVPSNTSSPAVDQASSSAPSQAATSTVKTTDASTPRQGQLKTTLDDGSVYDGAWKNDQKHGAGQFTHKSTGSVYTGSWLDDKRAGKGVFTAGTGTSAVRAVGGFSNNLLDSANAVFTLADGCVFEFATFNSSGQITGGKLTYKDGEVYEGAFNPSGKRHGSGVWRGKDGGQYNGEYKDDLRHGVGEYHYPDGGVYKGNWKTDLPDGDGVFLDKSGKIITGVWAKGKLTNYTLS